MLKTQDLSERKNIPGKAPRHVPGHAQTSEYHVDIVSLSAYCVTAQRNLGILPGSQGKQRS